MGGGLVRKIGARYYKISYKKRKLKLRSANSVRPWIHVLDCIHGYLYLASRMNEKVIKNGSSWNISNVGKKHTTSDIIKNFKEIQI